MWKPANRIYFNPVRFPAVGVLQRWIRAQWEPSQDGDDKAGVDFRWWRFLTCGSMGNLYLENNCFRTVCVCLIHLFYLVNNCFRIIYLYLIRLLHLENDCFRIIYVYLIHLSICTVLWTICLYFFVCMYAFNVHTVYTCNQLLIWLQWYQGTDNINRGWRILYLLGKKSNYL